MVKQERGKEEREKRRIGRKEEGKGSEGRQISSPRDPCNASRVRLGHAKTKIGELPHKKMKGRAGTSSFYRGEKKIQVVP